MRMVLALMLLAAGCGAERHETAAPPAPAPVEPAPAAPALAAPAPECASSAECSFTGWPDVTTAADCACPSCDERAMSLTRMDELAERFARVCGEWQRTHTCTPPICDARFTLCVGGRCLEEPVTPSESGVGPPCRHPGECPGGVRCVITALGGDLGCTDGACCGTAECSNGCATDADCPECRPVCQRGGCGLRRDPE